MGTLTREVPASLEFLQVYKPPDTAIRKAKKKKVKLVKMARNKQNQLGETIFKGHRSYDLMLNLQVGAWVPLVDQTHVSKVNVSFLGRR